MRVKKPRWKPASIVDTLSSSARSCACRSTSRTPASTSAPWLRRFGRRLHEACRGPQRLAANIHLGAKGVATELSDHAKDVAVRASKAVGLEISGVDMIFRGDTPYVLEVNASPGFRGLMDATGVNGRGRDRRIRRRESERPARPKRP